MRTSRFFWLCAWAASLVIFQGSWAQSGPEQPSEKTLGTQPQQQAPLYSSMPYLTCFEAAAERYALPPSLLMAVAIVESGLDPMAVSSANALGLMQIKWPITAKHLDVAPREALFDPCTNIDAGARYLRELLDRRNRHNAAKPLHLTLASYRLGPSGFDASAPLPTTARNYIQAIAKQKSLLDLAQPSVSLVQPRRRPNTCSLAELSNIAMSTHHPAERAEQASAWLRARAGICELPTLLAIRNSLPLWLGTGLNGDLVAFIGQQITLRVNQ